MTTIITPVGTSLFTNGPKVDPDIEDLYADLRDLRDSDWDLNLALIEQLRQKGSRFIAAEGVTAAAELQSSLTIKDQLGHNIIVHLLASDTVTSRLAAEILLANATALGDQASIVFNYPVDIIRGLQVGDDVEFSDPGTPNLLKRLYSIRDSLEDGQMLAINITGGYAVTVPLLTIFGQVNAFPLYYNFENTTSPIKIPQLR